MKNRILRQPEVLHRCGISRSTMYRWIAEGVFPRQRSMKGLGQKDLGQKGRAVGWLESDIDAWIDSRMSVGE
ncbi:TPA: helix-turn-helix transcriptional regulator [Serratia fonticola]